ncbi:SRPBCC family protein [Mycobacterium sp. TY815]|uniref:SRPBCC family protein n=1 Tax=Mycobacterium sp. TY815 TaxID=3050581 RepID=UPI000F90AD2F|nr:SRPBCC family protein [Mycobacterium sp. TY815]MDP7706413.1 SRPBCC family protein [Mycobacterium sp. TY815]RUP04811.1 MAG: SRPBCC family protein [Mycobacterium sp.]
MNDSAASKTAVLVKALGAASLGLGLSEIVAPGRIAALAGVDETRRSRAIIRALGMRECGHGAALLAGPDKLVWTRVAGDVLDVAFLGAGVMRRGPGRRRRGLITAAALTAIGGADLYAALRTTHGDTARHAGGQPPRTLRAAVTVLRTPEYVYGFWRNLENLPTFMHHLQSVTTAQDGCSHWIANSPVGQPVQWDAQITEDLPGKRIAWQSLPGSGIENSGCVDFTPDPTGKSTEVRVTMAYQMPGGALGKAAATLLGESPDQQVNDDLRRFKQILETGQVLRSDGSPDGTVARRQLHQQSAQPSGKVVSR